MFLRRPNLLWIVSPVNVRIRLAIAFSMGTLLLQRVDGQTASILALQVLLVSTAATET